MVEQVCQCRPEEGDVGDGEAERVDLGEALLVGEGRHVQPQLLERRVDARRTMYITDQFSGPSTILFNEN